MKCESCQVEIAETIAICPNCGATNQVFVRNNIKIEHKPAVKSFVLGIVSCGLSLFNFFAFNWLISIKNTIMFILPSILIFGIPISMAIISLSTGYKSLRFVRLIKGTGVKLQKIRIFSIIGICLSLVALIFSTISLYTAVDILVYIFLIFKY